MASDGLKWGVPARAGTSGVEVGAWVGMGDGDGDAVAGCPGVDVAGADGTEKGLQPETTTTMMRRR